MVRTFLKVYMDLGSYFLFLQEQIKDIIICRVQWRFSLLRTLHLSSCHPVVVGAGDVVLGVVSVGLESVGESPRPDQPQETCQSTVILCWAPSPCLGAGHCSCFCRSCTVGVSHTAVCWCCLRTLCVRELFIGTQFSNLYTVGVLLSMRVVCCVRVSCSCAGFLQTSRKPAVCWFPAHCRSVAPAHTAGPTL